MLNWVSSKVVMMVQCDVSRKVMWVLIRSVDLMLAHCLQIKARQSCQTCHAAYGLQTELRCYNQTSCLMFHLLEARIIQTNLNLDQQLTQVCQLNVFLKRVAARQQPMSETKMTWHSDSGWKLKLIWSNVDESHWLRSLFTLACIFSFNSKLFQLLFHWIQM